MLFSRGIILTLIAVIAFGVPLIVVMHFTDACQLEQVRLNDRNIDNWPATFGLHQFKPLIRQPLDSLADVLLARKDVFRVDIDYALPDGISIRTNAFRPVGFLADKNSGDLFGLDEQARLIPLRDDEADWEHPVLTSLDAGRLFEHCRDARVSVIIAELEQLRRDNVDLYRLIEEIDLGAEACLNVTISGLPYRLKLRAESFGDDLGRFVEFVGSFNPVLDSVTLVDLRFDQMIVCTERKK